MSLSLNKIYYFSIIIVLALYSMYSFAICFCPLSIIFMRFIHIAAGNSHFHCWLSHHGVKYRIIHFNINECLGVSRMFYRHCRYEHPFMVSAHARIAFSQGYMPTRRVADQRRCLSSGRTRIAKLLSTGLYSFTFPQQVSPIFHIIVLNI